MTQTYSPYRYVNLDRDFWLDMWRAEHNRRKEASRRTGGHAGGDASGEARAWIHAHYLEELFRFPEGELRRLEENPRKSKRVCIIGGGIAGLTAAYELARRQHTVVLLEASERFGGRILTHHFDSELYGELGAMRIPELHACVMHYVKQFNLGYRTFVTYNPNGWLRLRGRDPVPLRNYRDMLGAYSLLDRERATLGGASPDHQLAVLMDNVAPEILQLGSVLQDFTFPSEKLWALENHTMMQILRHSPMDIDHGLQWSDIQAGLSTRLGDGPRAGYLSDQGYEYIGRATGVLWLERASFLQFWLNELALTANKVELNAGMDQLVNAFVTAIKALRPVGATIRILQKRSKVTDVVVGPTQVEVTWRARGAERTQQFDYVICTVPALATAHIRFDPPLHPRKYEALTNLTYSSAAKSIVRSKVRFWELHDGIAGGASYTDLPNQQIWYPSDNCQPGAEEVGQLPHLGASAVDFESAPSTWIAADNEKSKRPAVFTAAYMWETNARRFMALSESQKTALIRNCVSAIHGPEALRFIEDIQHRCWDNYAGTGGGAWAFFGPGELQRYQFALCQPHQSGDESEPRVFFAGEHVAILHAWIQSAIQSSLASVLDVLAAP